MASTINATSTGSGGLITTGNSVNQLEIQTGDTTRLVIDGSGNVTIQGQGDLRLADSDSSHYVALQAPGSMAANVTYTLPGTDGTNGQVLQTNGSGTLSFATPSSGAMTLISTQTASNSASLSWTGLATYRSYLLILSNIVPQTSADQFNIRVGTGSGPTYITTNYYHSEIINASNSSGVGGNAGAGDDTIEITGGNTVVATTSSGGLSAVIYLVNMLASPAADTRIIFDCNYAYGTTAFRNVQGSGTVYNNTTAKTAVQVFFDTQNIASGSATLYGLQSS